MKIAKNNPYFVGLLIACILGAAFIGFGFYKSVAVPANALKIMTYNIGDTRSPAAENYIETLAGIIRKESPDIVLLQEAYRPKAEKLAGFTGYRMLSMPENETQQHVQILSRQPLRFVEAKKLSAHVGVGENVVCAEVETDKGPLLACSVYFTSIRSEIAKDKMHDKAALASMSLKEVFLENSRSREAKELVDWLASLQYEYMLIGGDFNSISLSKTARTMRGLFKDCAWISPSLFSSSHNIQGFHLPVKVDYIFVSKNISYSGSRIIQKSPGDHYPVVTNIRLD